MAMFDVTQENFNENTEKGLKLVDLWAPWCGACKMIAPSVEAISEEQEGSIDVLKVNIDEEPEIASDLGVMSIPTLILYNDGEQVESITGFKPKEEIESLIEQYK